MESGVQADVLVCRTERELGHNIRTKLARFCNVKEEAVIQSIDASTIYDVPNLMMEEGLDRVVLGQLQLEYHTADLSSWNNFIDKLKNPNDEVTIGLIGKYVELQDSYKSILEAFIHAGAANEVKVVVESIHSEFLSQESIAPKLAHLDGILVAPGFGERGIEGKIQAIKYVREHQIPFFGICLGMQMAVIEFSRHVIGLSDANSTEMNPQTSHPVIDLMEAQKEITDKGGTMRLGSWDCNLLENNIAHRVYGTTQIAERHRHRYEFNNAFKHQIELAGLKASGLNPETGLVEIVELNTHPWFVGVQYHPEYKSTVANPHPLFLAFIKAALKHKKTKL
jgi:CTP synthase